MKIDLIWALMCVPLMLFVADEPAFKAIEVRQTGGFAGVDIRYRIAANGVFSRKSDQGAVKGELDAKQAESLHQAVGAINWKSLPKELRAPNVADDFVYEIHVVAKTGKFRVTADGTSAGKHAQLKTILKAINAIQRLPLPAKG